MLKWRGASHPSLCLQLLSKMLRGNNSRSANVQTKCVCILVRLSQEEAVLRIQPLFLQEDDGPGYRPGQ